MAELLFEILCEEIPARMQDKAGRDLTTLMTDGLTAAGLTVDKVQSFTGPRRLVYVADVPLRSPDVSEERKGPRVGSPEQALAGFMRGAGLSDISEAQIKSDPKKGEFYVAVIEKSGADTSAILGDLIPDIMNNFPWPKSMKSGRTSFRWVRPLQSMICLLDGAVVPVTVGGVESGNVTHGHRRMGPGPFTVTGLSNYSAQLERDGHVVLSAAHRKDTILTDARKACADKGLELVEDAGLLSEVAGLVEWPVVILGDMDPSFLELPGEVIRLSMRTHQKYFAVKDPKTGALAPHFIVVANQDAPDGGKAIAEGNSRVLSARLADAKFFQSEDAKKKLIDYYDKLDTVVFHKWLGSIGQKSIRVAALARELAPVLGANPDACEYAAMLAKCDLVTNMVVEFTSLQGQIGANMYRAEGGDKDIALAIEEQYKPQGSSDSVPTNSVAVVIALADKLDTLVGFWTINEKPTGSKDPFALRRAALGVVRILLENEVRLNVASAGWASYKELIFQRNNTPEEFFTTNDIRKDSYPLWDKFDMEGGIFIPNQDFDIDSVVVDLQHRHFKKETVGIWPSFREVSADLLTFILDRLRGDLRDKGFRHDIIDAAFATGGDDLVAITNRVSALQDFLLSESGTDLLAGYKRASNILKAEAKKGELPSGEILGGVEALTNPLARELEQALSKARIDIESALATESYDTAMTALSALRVPIDAFFDDVMVVDDDPNIRANNLRLLGMIRDTAAQIADFDQIDG
ncbi:glycine--tRNA ligase subunit beta [Fretibacter rubidus]|uniref:glycine--tRNA ligase subunit beta n=1 Tax=Fretibacter rubidus TaxID=570162 RepID=UPI00352AD65A